MTMLRVLLLSHRLRLRHRNGFRQQLLFPFPSLVKGPLGRKTLRSPLLGKGFPTRGKTLHRTHQPPGKLQSSPDSHSSPHNRDGLWL